MTNQNPPGNELTGGEALARMIQAFHGGAMFGMGGFQLLPFYDAARRLGLDGGVLRRLDRNPDVVAQSVAVLERFGLIDVMAQPVAGGWTII